jgi:hypothetical protein
MLMPRSPALLLVSLLAFAAPLAAQDHAPKLPGGPTPEQVKATVDELKSAEKSTKVDEHIAAIGRASAVEDPDVVRALDSGLYDKDEAVKIATIKAFGHMQTPDALQSLHRLAKSKKLEKDSKPLAALYRAIGMHGDRSSVEVLAADIPSNLDVAVVRSRIYGLANIRHIDAVEALIKAMNLGNPLPGEDSPFMPDVEVALARLTGTDQTTNKSLWQEWWNKNKKDFRVAPTPPELPRALQEKWDDFWGNDLPHRPKDDVDLPHSEMNGPAKGPPADDHPSGG